MMVDSWLSVLVLIALKPLQKLQVLSEWKEYKPLRISNEIWLDIEGAMLNSFLSYETLQDLCT